MKAANFLFFLYAFLLLLPFVILFVVVAKFIIIYLKKYFTKC